jgi:hypothetical protein
MGEAKNKATSRLAQVMQWQKEIEQLVAHEKLGGTDIRLAACAMQVLGNFKPSDGQRTDVQLRGYMNYMARGMWKHRVPGSFFRVRAAIRAIGEDDELSKEVGTVRDEKQGLQFNFTYDDALCESVAKVRVRVVPDTDEMLFIEPRDLLKQLKRERKIQARIDAILKGDEHEDYVRADRE